MGEMTSLTFCNDILDQIKKYPEEFIKNIELGIEGITKYGTHGRYINSYGIGNCANGIMISQSHHANNFKLYLVGQNMMTSFGLYNKDLNNLELRKQLLNIAKEIIKEEENEIKKLEKK